MLCGATMFGVMGFLARIASVHTSWAVTAATRAMIGAAIAIAIARARGSSLVVQDRGRAWARSLFGTVATGSVFYAMGSPALSLGDASTLANLGPVVIALLAPSVLGERGGRRVWFALALSLAGVVLILKPAMLSGQRPAVPGALTAALVAVLASVSGGLAMLMLRKLGPRESPEAVVTHFAVTSSIVLSLVALSDLSLPQTAGEGLAMLGAGVAAGLAQIAMTRAYAAERAARVSCVSYWAIVVSAGLGAMAWGEWPTPTTLLGMGLVVAGGMVVTVVGLRERGERARTPLLTRIRGSTEPG